MEYTVPGIITSICNESGVVSFAIDGTPKTFCFSKNIFYAFGIPCEGSIANILDEGMEVQVYCECCPHQKLRLIAVWLGDPPDAACLRNKIDREVPRAVYDRKGRVTRLIDDQNFLVRSDDIKVICRELQVHRDDGVLNVVLDEEVWFDAIPLEDKHFSGARYEATCVWISNAPGLVERFCLNAAEDPLVVDLAPVKDRDLFGTVVVIPNDVVAIVEVEVHNVVFEVMLFRDSFDEACDRIKDVVDVGDGVFLRAKSCFIFNRCRQWVAVRACRAEFELFDFADEAQTSVLDAEKRNSVQILLTVVAWVLDVAKRLSLLHNRVGVLFAICNQREACVNIQERVSGRVQPEVVPVRDEVGLGSDDVLFPEAGIDEVPLLEESAEKILSKVSLDYSLGFELTEILFPEVDCAEDEAESDQTLSDIILCEATLRSDKMSIPEESDEEVSLDQGVIFSEESSESSLLEVCLRQELDLVVDSEEAALDISSDHEEVILESSEGIVGDTTCGSSNCRPNNTKETKLPVSEIKSWTEVLCGNPPSKKVLYSNPPLSGELWSLDNDCGLITYEDLNIFVESDCFFVNGERKPIRDFLTGRNNKFVNFEAVLVDREKCGCRYVATCAWSDIKPLVMVAAAGLPPPNLALLEEKDRVFYGYVAKLCLPSFAVAVIPGENTSVGVHLVNFVHPLGRVPLKGALITDFVTLNDVVKFKIEGGCKILRAYEVQSTTYKKEHWEEANGGVFVCHEIRRRRKAVTI